MDSSVIGGIVRTVLATVGGTFVAKGYVDADTLNQIIGAVIVLGTGAWSVFQKVRAKK